MTKSTKPVNVDAEFAAALKALKESYHHLLMASWGCHQTAMLRFSSENAAQDGLFDGATDMLARQVSAIQTETRRLRKAVKLNAQDIEEIGE